MSGRWQGWGSVAVLLALILAMAAIEPRFGRPSNLLTILIQAAPLAIAAYGEAVVVAVGEIDLSTGSLAALVSVAAVLAAKSLGAGAGWLSGVALGAGLGLVNGVLVAQWGIPSFIATVGMLTYAQGMALLIGGGVPIEFPPLPFAWVGQGRIGPIPVPVVLAAAAGAGMHLLLGRTVFGRWVYAAGGNAVAAQLAGVPVRRVRLWALLLSGALAGLAAVVLSARVVSGQPNLEPNLAFEAIAALAVGGFPLGGGRGTILQVSSGTLIFSVLANGLTLANVSSYVQQMDVGVITILAILLTRGPAWRARARVRAEQ